jgi:hypothetical protein
MGETDFIAGDFLLPNSDLIATFAAIFEKIDKYNAI